MTDIHAAKWHLQCAMPMELTLLVSILSMIDAECHPTPLGVLLSLMPDACRQRRPARIIHSRSKRRIGYCLSAFSNKHCAALSDRSVYLYRVPAGRGPWQGQHILRWTLALAASSVYRAVERLSHVTWNQTSVTPSRHAGTRTCEGIFIAYSSVELGPSGKHSR
eukprot:6177276-Pleurochrysis_carterae.AAC.1